MQNTLDELLVSIERHFAFLFKQGYQVVYTEDTQTFDNVLVILGSKDAKIRFHQDRGEAFMAIGPALAQNNWDDSDYLDLDVILGFIEHYDEFKEDEGECKGMDAQIRQLAVLFHPQFKRIISMFQSDIFPQTKKELQDQWKRMFENFKNKYNKKPSRQ